MVVGVLTTSYPRYPGDAAGSFVADDVRRLVARGFQVEVLAAGDGPVGVTRSPDAARADHEHDGPVRVTRISLGLPRGSSLFYGEGEGAPEVFERRRARARLASWVAAASFTAALCREVGAAAGRWQSMVSHWLAPCALAAIAAAPRLRARHRGVAHSGDVALLERMPLGSTIARHIAGSGADLVFVSADLKRRFAALAGRPVGRVERLAPDAALFAPASAADRAAARRRLGLTRPTVVAVGRLVPIKGFDLLIDAVGASVAIDDAVDVIILGAGPEDEALRARARRRGVTLRLPGQVAHDQVAAWLAAGDVYVQPSRVMSSGRSEGLPLATLEALAVGLPVVASRSGGLAELGRGDGRVSFFEPGDAASLRGALAVALRQANRI